MSLRRRIGYNEAIVGAAQMGLSPGHDEWVTIDIPVVTDGGYAMSPAVARSLAKALTRWANVLDPPPHRRKKIEVTL